MKKFKDKLPEVYAEMKRLRRKPKLGRRMTYAKIAERLNEMGYTNTNGKPFKGNMVLKILQG